MSYKNIYAPLLWLLTVLLLTACSLEPADYPTPSEPKADSDRLIVLCEGLWGMDNSSLSLIDNGVLTNRWFQQQNPGRHLGDTGNDILQVNDTLIAISVNWSNIVQYIRPDGTAIAQRRTFPTTAGLQLTTTATSTSRLMPTTVMWRRWTYGQSRWWTRATWDANRRA